MSYLNVCMRFDLLNGCVLPEKSEDSNHHFDFLRKIKGLPDRHVWDGWREIHKEAGDMVPASSWSAILKVLTLKHTLDLLLAQVVITTHQNDSGSLPTALRSHTPEGFVKSVVQLKAVFPHGAGFVLAFEFMLSDLAEVVRHAQRPLAQAQVKSYLQMLLKGVAFCHANNIVHRDLKPANLLISASGQLKIADFGLARVFSPDGSRLYTHQVATRWYRAPELLYGARQYDQGVDLWAVGCIMGELLNGSPLFPGENDIEQLCYVLRILGTPNPQVWPELTELPDYNKISFKEQAPVPLEEVLPDASPQALDLLGQFLLYPPRQRIAASKVITAVSKHPTDRGWTVAPHKLLRHSFLCLTFLKMTRAEPFWL
ncbi:PREDICTED: cyclin-dependent kinase 20 isoform X2 [Cercocebus atys]|uniref:cyclin-dependent kinase 20 isoform X2 n=1 Tax=Cercocebus atys TaxID=9531 RepID=UPI0005F4C0D2|nr:PREDICTED: cyclin-dependent kinase 20 isoform X2 [Cercocebus atys]